jgi:arylsulfatase A-like enzyme
MVLNCRKWRQNFKDGLLVETVDIAPTVLSYLGLPVPRRMQGHDLMPLIRGEEDTGRDAAFAAVGRKGISMGYAIRTASWLYFFDSKEKERLINIDNDNGRLISLISQQPEKRKELRGILARWIDRTPVVGSGENAPISEEIRQMLIKGGYLEDAK